MKRKKKGHDQAAADPEPARVAIPAETITIAPPENITVAPPDNVTVADDNGTLFEGIDAPSALEVRSDGLPALDSDLTPDQKKEFTSLIRAEMSLAERAKQLATLARFTDTKRAPVALRAIVEMNLLDGMREEKPNEAAPLFRLPDDSKMAILVQKVVK